MMQEQKSYVYPRWPTNCDISYKKHSKKAKKIETKDQEGQAQFIMKSISNKYIFIVLWHYLFLKE